MLNKTRIAALLFLLVGGVSMIVFQYNGSSFTGQSSGGNTECYAHVAVGEQCPNGWMIVTSYSSDGMTCEDPTGCGCYADTSQTCSCVGGQMGQCSAGGCMCMDVCGDGIVTGTEECDDGNMQGADGCSSMCKNECFQCSGEMMGNTCMAIVASDCSGFQNMYDSMSECTDNCRGSSPVCGDGTVDDGEECDDGNTVNGDGCSNECMEECMDTDGDGTDDCSDNCPSDSKKTEPGVCGCGSEDIDSDGDGALDCNDGCPSDPDKSDPMVCGCGMPDCSTDDGTKTICCDPTSADNNMCLKGYIGQPGEPGTTQTVSCAEGCQESADCVDPSGDKNDCYSAYCYTSLLGEKWCRDVKNCPDSGDVCKEADDSPGTWECAECYNDEDGCGGGGGVSTTSGAAGGATGGGMGGIVGGLQGGDSGGDTGGDTGDDDDEMKCKQGSRCFDNRCVFIKSCSTISTPPDIGYDCSGIGENNTCVDSGGSSSAGNSSSSDDEYMCCNGGCIKIGDPIDGYCASPAYCASACSQACGGDNPTHTECIDNACTEVAGEGEDGCSNDNDCTTQSHGVCHGTTCAQEPGAGEDLCSSNSDCTNDGHLECRNDQCVFVQGPGSNRCDTVLGCSTGQHAVCVNNECRIVSGDGDNECSTDINCLQHSICEDNACKIVDGEGENECASNDECLAEQQSSSSLGFSSSAGQQSSSVSKNISSSALSSFVSEASSSSSSTGSTVSSTIIAQASSSDDSSEFSLEDSSASSFSSSESSVEADISSISRDTSSSAAGKTSSLTVIAQASSKNTSSPYTILNPNEQCGNNFLNAGEECDDGNTRNGDGCDTSCQLEESAPVSCISDTECPSALCRNSVCLCSADEMCKSGEQCIGGVCTKHDVQLIKETLVAAASVCGNGILEKKEECDDRNRRDDDGCSSTCLLEIGICGDGIIQSMLGEQCEGTKDCSQCRFVSKTCGDGNLDPGEECDEGALNSSSPDANCRPDCSLSRCGDAVLDSQELCDDGNRRNNDGCDRYCVIEQSDKPDTSVKGANTTVQFPTLPTNVLSQSQQNQQQQFQFPQYSNFQQLPYQLPLAQLQPLIQSQGPIGDTGPAAVAVVASGMAAGLGWMRRRK